jgi:integrase
VNRHFEAVNEYVAMRRKLGFKLRRTAHELPRFAAFLEREGAPHITTTLALRWALEDPDSSVVTRSDRLAMVRRFAAWRRATDPGNEIPPSGLLPRRYERPAPYIYSDDQVERLVAGARSLPSTRGIRGLTCSVLFALLAVTGMRVGEAVALDRSDIDLEAGVLSIREGKYGKSRFIPLDPTTQRALADYAKETAARFPASKMPALFVSERGRRMSAWSAGDNFIKVLRGLELRSLSDGRRRGRGPRLHDLRHRFAVYTLIRWYRAGADIDREMPKLATYLGHTSVAEVYWYLQAVPELLSAATDTSRVTPNGAS